MMDRSQFLKRFAAITLLSSTANTLFGQQRIGEGNILIVYLSRTNNTKAVAEMIQKEVGGDLVALTLTNPYPEDYKTIVDQVEKENESGYLPQLATKVKIGNYDTIFIGFPTWGMQLPPPIKAFLNTYDLTGKTIVPFNTNAGSAWGIVLKHSRS